MSVDMYRYEEECSVERTENIVGPVAELYDCDGDKVWTFPDSFTDEQIMAALAFANHAYKVGISIGSDRKAEEIRRALGVSAAA
ncbi:hypothetical protein T6R82_003476 [Salmonella enterica subsp. enterica serovar Montevideo]|nr:hypothetical protein [Salmonella enterica subsp. enterica serovar Montevideo]ELZ3187237.1 hypothetical protein [Salmonella enterica subsp. enterica serovar Montevideo]